MSEYYPGKVVKKYREKAQWSQPQLADKWPRTDGGAGVDWHYVQLVEYGKRNITDQGVLRKIAAILSIPLWEFGLSDYNPFDPEDIPGQGKHLYSETIDVISSLVNQTLAMRRYAPLPEVERNAQALQSIITHFQESVPVPSRLEGPFAGLLILQSNLIGLMHFEHDEHEESMPFFEQMHAWAEQLQDPAYQILALTKLSVSYMRNHTSFHSIEKAVEAGELARDLSFNASKQAAAYSNAYLAHVYGASRDLPRFERAINAAINIAQPLGEGYGDGTDFIVHKFSGILQLRSRGYLRLNQPKKILQLHDELQRHITADGNLWLDHRLHLYRGRAFLQLKDIESCIGAIRELFRDVRDWKSPHRTGRAYELLEQVDKAGYGGLSVVKNFKEELIGK